MTRIVDGQPMEQEELEMTLLSFVHIVNRDEEVEIDSVYAISFDSVAHVQEMEHIFH